MDKYVDHNDSVTVIDHKRKYVVRAPARHPVYENFRVKVSYNFHRTNSCFCFFVFCSYSFFIWQIIFISLLCTVFVGMPSFVSFLAVFSFKIL